MHKGTCTCKDKCNLKHQEIHVYYIRLHVITCLCTVAYSYSPHCSNDI